MFARYYQEELTFLRELGREFAEAHPDAAHFLADRGSDPDVERLLEGFAFLAGQIRQKLDDELPEVTHSLMGLLWPHYLRPIPSMTMMQFAALPGAAKERRTIPRGTEVDSIPIEGTACRFRTAFDVALEPVELVEAALEVPLSGAASVRLRLRAAAGAKLPQLRLDTLRFHLSGEPQVVSTLYLLLSRHVTGVTVQSLAAGRAHRSVSLPADSVRLAGFAENQTMLPYPTHAFAGYRVIQEYFAFPQKFHFVDVTGLSPVTDLGGEDLFEIIIHLARGPAAETRVTPENLLLGCTPAVNVFERDADPIRVEHDKTEYLVRPSGKDPAHYEIYSVESVVGYAEGTAEQKAYPSFFSFVHSSEGTPAAEADALYHHARLHPAVAYDGSETYVSFLTVSARTALPTTETISMELMCTNRRLPRSLRVGDIHIATRNSPEFARFRNISKPTGSVSPPMEGNLFWRLISNLSLNYLSLASPEALRGVLALYNFQALYDRQAARENELRLEAIRSVSSKREEALFRGAPVRGLAVEVELLESNFGGEGDMILFASVLNEFLALYASLNSFSRLTIKGSRSGEVYGWPARLGSQNIL